MDYLNLIDLQFPIRRSATQKQAFRSFAEAECERLGVPVRTELLQGKHANVVIGDIQSAKVVFTAHYDTPGASLLPNLMAPRSHLLFYLYQIGYPTAIAMACLLASKWVQGLLALGGTVSLLLYVGLYLAAFYLCTRAFTNKHNKNDNTSGVATVLSMVGKCDQAAFILFDNEEKGLLGSKACAKAHKALFENKLVINLDCVGVGDQILVVAKEKATELESFRLLQESLKDGDGFRVLHFPAKGSHGNSDHKSFPCGVGVMACKPSKWLGYYTTDIHTGRDTYADPKNIAFLSDALTAYAEKL